MFSILIHLLTLVACISVNVLAKTEKVFQLKYADADPVTDLDKIGCWNGKGVVPISVKIIVSGSLLLAVRFQH